MEPAARALPAGRLTADRANAIRQTFSEAYRATFGRTIDEARPELVTWRCSAASPVSPLSLGAHDRGAAATAGSRPIRFLDFGELETPVDDCYGLAPGTVIQGPALFTERTASCSFGPDFLIRVDESRNLVVDIDTGC
jgi:N-methylhydantoinase A